MEATIDPDVKAVAELMQSRIEARKLVGVAEMPTGFGADPIWRHYDSVPVFEVELVAEKIKCASQSAATGLPPVSQCVDGDSAEAVGTCVQTQLLSHKPRTGKCRSMVREHLDCAICRMLGGLRLARDKRTYREP